jgi:transcriptional regulator with XRE-family HTH domain
MTHIGKNIKKIRSVKKISQANFAEIFDLNRGSVGAYEEGRAEPKIDTIIQIANHFSLSIDLLLNKELQVNELLSLNILNEKMDKAHHFEKPTKAYRKGGIGLVYVKGYSEYIVNINSKDYIANLPYIELPANFKQEARAFELNGSEMEYHQNGLHHGDILLCQRAKYEDKFPTSPKVYTIVLKNEIITRRLAEVKQNELVLSSDDPNYELLRIKRKDIVEIWEVRGVFSTYLNPPKMIEERVMLLEKKLNRLEASISE